MLNRLSRSCVVLLAFALGCAGTIDDNDLPLDSPPSDPNQALIEMCPNGREPPAVRGLRISELALFQTVKNRLYFNGTWQLPEVPLIAGKRALLRIYLEPVKLRDGSEYEPQNVRAVVTLRNGHEGRGVSRRAQVKEIVAKSSEGDRLSTLEVDLDGSLLRTGTALSVALQQEECEPREGKVASQARLPIVGEQPLPFQTVRKLRVTVLPIVTKGGLTPDVGRKELETIETAMRAYYPVPDVEVTAHREKLVFPRALPKSDADKTWSELLEAVRDRRAKDRADDDVYYYGLVSPAESQVKFCGEEECLLGLSYQPTVVSPSSFAGLGVAFPETRETTYRTAVHEVGHQHGLAHAPCGGVKEPDPSFPGSGGITNSWGWDFRANQLKKPNAKDIMGYCEEPDVWISTYFYKVFANRVLLVNKMSALASKAPVTGRFRPLFVTEDGRARWGNTVLNEPPSGEPGRGYLRAASGETIAEIALIRVPVSHGAPMLYVPELGDAWTTLELDDGRTVARNAIEPALVLE